MMNLTLKGVGLVGVYIVLVSVTWLVARTAKGQMKRWANGMLRKLTKGYLGGE